jgi:CRP-like cAMP-binding protein
MQLVNSYKPKQVLFKADQPASETFNLQSGEVLCLKYFKGRLTPIYLAKSGDSIGEQAMIAGSNYSYYAITLSNVEAQTVPTSVFTDDFDNSHSWLKDLIETMIKRFEHTASLIAENRVESNNILESYSPTMEIEFKKLLGL